VNDPAAKANPITYQIPVKAILAQSARAVIGARSLVCWVSEAFATNRKLRPSPWPFYRSGPRVAGVIALASVGRDSGLRGALRRTIGLTMITAIYQLDEVARQTAPGARLLVEMRMAMITIDEVACRSGPSRCQPRRVGTRTCTSGTTASSS
jgi:hypothetical protein